MQFIHLKSKKMNYKNILKIVFMLMPLLFILTACDKDEDEKDELQEVNFHIHTNFGHQELKINHDYFIDDRKIVFDHVAYYLSEFTLHREGGEDVILDDTYLLVTHDEMNYKGQKVEPGNYSGYSFVVGVPANKNTDEGADAKDPSEYEEGHPLGFHSPSMHWSWNTGYIFVRIDGQVDVSEAKDGSQMESLTIHLGTDNLLRQVHMHENFIVHTSIPRTLHLDVNLRHLLSHLDLQVENSTMTMNNPELAEKIADRIPEIFGSH
ncbi:MAG: hypothetical protein EA412_12245 [Chitinophagaceae bacterium]|nr:MAG: hypothetical protein EA412_12245 [Chitinophagaceae bacterium]